MITNPLLDAKKATEWKIFYEWADHYQAGCATIKVHAVEPLTAIQKALQQLNDASIPVIEIKVLWSEDSNTSPEKLAEIHFKLGRKSRKGSQLNWQMWQFALVTSVANMGSTWRRPLSRKCLTMRDARRCTEESDCETQSRAAHSPTNAIAKRAWT